MTEGDSARRRLVPTYLDDHQAAHWRAVGAWTDRLLTELDVDESPDAVIVVDRDRRLTAAELRSLSTAVAARLVADGVSAGDAVAMQVPNWWEAVVVTFAVMSLGAVLVPLLPGLRERELGQIFREIRPVAAVVPETFRESPLGARLSKAEHAPPLVYLLRPASPGSVRSLVAELEGENPGIDAPLGAEGPRDADEPCVVLYTSGTSSIPKGVIHTHNTLRAEVDGLAAAHRMTPEDVILLPMPVTHVGGLVYGVLIPALTRTRCVFLDVWEPAAAIELMRREQITVCIGMPVFLRGILDDPTFTVDAARNLRLFSMGGTRVTPADVTEAATRLGCWCKRSYGLTEAPTLTTGPFWDTSRRADTDGLPISPSRVRIVDAEFRDLPVLAEGEIICVAPELFVGYVDPHHNIEAFTPDRWFRTGDIGRVDADGFLSVTGRLKDIIIRGGENISAKEVEDLLITLPGLTDVAVVAMPDPVLGERVCAFVESDGDLRLEDIVQFLREQGVASYKLPERLELRLALPRNSAGKLRKDLMRAEVAALIEAGKAS